MNKILEKLDEMAKRRDTPPDRNKYGLNVLITEFDLKARSEHELLEKALRIAYEAIKCLNDSVEQQDGMTTWEAKYRISIVCREIEALFEEKK